MRLPVTTARSGGGEGGASQADAQHERAAEAARERDEGGAADLSMPAGVNGASSRQRATQPRAKRQHEGCSRLNLNVCRG